MVGKSDTVTLGNSLPYTSYGQIYASSYGKQHINAWYPPTAYVQIINAVWMNNGDNLCDTYCSEDK